MDSETGAHPNHPFFPYFPMSLLWGKTFTKTSPSGVIRFDRRQAMIEGENLKFLRDPSDRRLQPAPGFDLSNRSCVDIYTSLVPLENTLIYNISILPDLFHLKRFPVGYKCCLAPGFVLLLWWPSQLGGQNLQPQHIRALDLPFQGSCFCMSTAASIFELSTTNSTECRTILHEIE